MLLVVEILLTIAAWKKGWKAKALLPLGMLLLIGFAIGILASPSGPDWETLIVTGVLLDMLGIVALSIMISVPPKVTAPDPPDALQAQVNPLPESALAK